MRTVSFHPVTGRFAGSTVTSNPQGYGMFVDGRQICGTADTPRFRDSRHLSRWVRVRFR